MHDISDDNSQETSTEKDVPHNLHQGKKQTARKIQILPYSRIVGQKQLKLALELIYIAPRLGGVLLRGQRGTGKSTAVRAFSNMMFDRLPVTLPINATEDRVVGGWDISHLMLGQLVRQPGLLEEAADFSEDDNRNSVIGNEAGNGLLYIDEINLLDDHIVNIILDVASTGILVVQRENQKEERSLSFNLVGTMNPEEGELRPQLLDRFGLMVNVQTENNPKERIEILKTVLKFDESSIELQDKGDSEFLRKAKLEDISYRDKLKAAKAQLYATTVPESVIDSCVKLTHLFESQGNRADYMIAIAARAYAALQGEQKVNKKHVAKVAKFILQHRRQTKQMTWDEQDDNKLVYEELGLDLGEALSRVEIVEDKI